MQPPEQEPRHGPAPAVALSLRLAALCAAGLAAACSGQEPPPPEPGATAAGSGYVGRKACEPCHAEVATTYAGTGMGRAFYPLTGETAIEDFTSSNRLEVPDQGLAYVMTSRDGSFFMRQIVVEPDGTEILSYEREMLWVLGSGNHSRSYLTGEQGYLYQMPVCWYPALPGWDLCPGYEHNNHFFMREAAGECLFCHNGRVPLLVNTTNRYAEGMPHGIGCERCHGPGRDHVAFWSSAPEEIPRRDTTIVDPGDLEREARVQVCMQCHLGDSGATERVVRTGRSLWEFVPGQGLDDYLDPATFAEAAENLYGLTAQADRMVRSRCFTASGGALECLTCHNPHVSVYSIEDPAAHFRAACLTCHGSGDCTVDREVRETREGGDDCRACHMRRSEPSDHPHSAFTDHWIRRRIDPPAPPLWQRTSLVLEPFFEPGRVERGNAEALANLGRAYQRMKNLNPLGHLIPWSAAEEPLRASVAADPRRPDARFTLGKLAADRGDAAEALGHFRDALALDPEFPVAHEEMGTLLLQLGRTREAVEALREAVRLQPDDLRSLTNLGRALVVEGDEAEGERLLRQAAKQVPAHSTPRANLGLLALRRDRPDEAVEHLRAAAAREPSRPEIWEALSRALQGAGRSEEATRAAARAARIRSGG